MWRIICRPLIAVFIICTLASTSYTYIRHLIYENDSAQNGDWLLHANYARMSGVTEYGIIITAINLGELRFMTCMDYKDLWKIFDYLYEKKYKQVVLYINK